MSLNQLPFLKKTQIFASATIRALLFLVALVATIFVLSILIDNQITRYFHYKSEQYTLLPDSDSTLSDRSTPVKK
jgi:type IV secretory pathway VirB6-like protein